MKPKLFLPLLLLTLSLVPTALSQTPQGINYQAIARDNNGDPITGATMQVRLGILSDTITPVTVWEELHSTVKTNAFGMFTAVLGTGVKQSGSALTFADIDWTKTPLYLRTWIYYPSSWKYLGTSKIWSVPYSLVAGGLDGALDKLEVVGDDVSSDEALFEVKRKDGETMFAVYNHGVRVYMPLDTLSKARKGGFAIGGFDRAKGIVQDYFVVNPDSIRAYIDSNPGKARKGGFAIGSFDRAKEDIQKYFTVSSDSVRIYIDDNLSKARKGGFAIGSFDRAKAGNANFFNVAPDSTGKIFPAQNRIQWYPLKNAFLTGKIIAENKDSVGENSFASGYESKAKGQYSQALGYQAIARGDYSTAIGKNAVANKINSFAFGENASAKNEESYAFGRGAIASGYRSFALGSAGLDQFGYVTDVARAQGDYSFSIGQGSRSTGKGAFSLGIADTASGDFSVALGHLASSRGVAAIAMGLYSFASGERSTSIGYQSIAKGAASTALGSYSRAIENYSVAIGYETFATGFNATAIGCKAIASGWISSSIGFENNSKGTISTAIGYRTIAVGDFSTSLGSHTLAKSLSSLAIGQYNDTTCSPSGADNWIATDPLFVIGNGTSDDSRSNAITVLKNGNVGITAINPTQKLEITGTNSKIYLNSATSNSILFNSNGVAPPTFTTRSNGSKIIIYPSLSGTYADYAIGIDNNTFWYSIPSASSSFSYKFYAGTTELVRISGNGNVGIGSPSPQAKLEVSDSNGDRIAFYAQSDNTLCVQTLLDNTPLSTYGTYGNNINNRLVLQPLVGNVGVGTSTPSYKLDVNGEITSRSFNALRLRQSTYSVISRNDNDSYYLLLTNANDPDGTWNSLRPFTVRLSTGNVILGAEGGNIGIGTWTPGTKLAIAGLTGTTSGNYLRIYNDNVYFYSSSIKTKEEIKPLDEDFYKILQANPVSFTDKVSRERNIGYIAEEFDAIGLKNLVVYQNGEPSALSYELISIYNLELIKDQQKTITDLKQQIETLTKRLSALEEAAGKK